MNNLQKKLIRIAAAHDCAASVLPDGSVLVESICVCRGDAYTVTDRIASVREMYIHLGY